MRINHSETMKRCKLINRAEVARQCGCSDVLVLYVIRGTYQSMDSEMAQRVLAKLRELNVLVEEPEIEQAA